MSQIKNEYALGNKPFHFLNTIHFQETKRTSHTLNISVIFKSVNTKLFRIPVLKARSSYLEQSHFLDASIVISLD